MHPHPSSPSGVFAGLAAQIRAEAECARSAGLRAAVQALILTLLSRLIARLANLAAAWEAGKLSTPRPTAPRNSAHRNPPAATTTVALPRHPERSEGSMLSSPRARFLADTTPVDRHRDRRSARVLSRQAGRSHLVQVASKAGVRDNHSIAKESHPLPLGERAGVRGSRAPGRSTIDHAPHVEKPKFH